MKTTNELEDDFDVLVGSNNKYISKRQHKIQCMIEEKINALEFAKQNAPICDITGDQTKVVNTLAIEGRVQELEDTITLLKEGIEVLKIENPNMPADVVSKITKLENQIKQLRDEGVSIALGASYVHGIPYGDNSNKPNIEDYAQGYGGGLHGEVQNELKDTLKEWFKGREEELDLPEEKPIEEVDSGFEILEFDPSRCAEAIMVDGEIRQCKNYKQAGSKYCHLHRKKYEEKERAA